MRYYYSHDTLYDGDPDPEKKPSWIKRFLAWIDKAAKANPPKCGC